MYRSPPSGPETGACCARSNRWGDRQAAQETRCGTVSQRMHDAVRDAAELMMGSAEMPSQAGVPPPDITAKLET